MTVVEVATIAALIAGPTLAVSITFVFQRREFVRNQRLTVFNTLMATRTNVTNPDFLRSLAMIDVVFSKKPHVLAKWHEYYESMQNPAFNDTNGGFIRLGKMNEMLAEMAKAMGYGKSIGFGELMRVYNPQVLADVAKIQKDTAEEFLRVLKASENLGTARVYPPATTLRSVPPPEQAQ